MHKEEITVIFVSLYFHCDTLCRINSVRNLKNGLKDAGDLTMLKIIVVPVASDFRSSEVF